MSNTKRYMNSILSQMSGIAIVAVLLSIFALIDYNGASPFKHFIFQLFYNGTLTFGLWFGNGLLVDYIKISWLKQPLKRLMITALLTFLVTMIVAIITRMIFAWVCCQLTPYWVLMNWDFGFYSMVLVITFFISSFMHGRNFFFQYRESILQAERLKQQHLEAQYEILKNQVNPHFLFNSLNILHAMVYKDPDQSARFIKQLSLVYRYVLDSREKEIVPLKEELKALEAYIFLMCTRFGDAFQFNQELSTYETIEVVPLSLQMLVENAIKHNAFSIENPLKIRMYYKEQMIWIENNLMKTEEKIASSNLGLSNIKARYEFLTNQSIELDVSETFFKVGLPVLSYSKD